MCEPTTIALASLAVTAAGTGMGYMQQQQAINTNRSNQNAAAARSLQLQREEQARQAALAEERRAMVTNDTAALTPEAQQQAYDAAAAQRQAQVDASAVTPADNPNTSGDLGRTFAAAKLSEALGDARGRIAAQSKLRAWDDLNRTNAQRFADTATRMSSLGGIARGSLDVYNQASGIPGATVTADRSLSDALTMGGGLGLQGAGYWRGTQQLGGSGPAKSPA